MVRNKNESPALVDRQSHEHEYPTSSTPDVDVPTKDVSTSLDLPGASIGRTQKNDAMMGLIEEPQREAHEGPSNSSATSFINELRTVIELDMNVHSEIPEPVSATSRHTLPQSTISPRLSTTESVQHDHLLPARQRSDYLLDLFQKLVWGLYPFLDMEEVGVFHSKLRNGEDLGEDHLSFMFLLNEIFCAATSVDTLLAPKDRVETAESFYQLSRRYLRYELNQQGSLLTVQGLMLMAMYLQGTNESQQCWIVVGLAIRMAQGLALDLPATSAKAQPERRRNMLRGVWHQCVLLDRTLSMVFGRPAIITSREASAVPRPVAHPQTSICSCFTGSQQGNTVGIALHHFNELLGLYDITDEILRDIYSPTPTEEADDVAYTKYFGNEGAHAVGNILQLNKKISWWFDHLPLPLREKVGTAKTVTHSRQINGLWLRYRHIRILLSRPVLSRFCRRRETQNQPLADGLPWTIARQCSVTCVRNALETIRYVDQAIPDEHAAASDQIMPAWWYIVFYVYTAATVLIAARLHPTIVTEFTETSINDAWQGAMRSLKHFQAFGPYAKRCALALRSLYERLPWDPEQQQPSHQRQWNVGRNRTTNNQANESTEVAATDAVTNPLLDAMSLSANTSFFLPQSFNAERSGSTGDGTDGTRCWYLDDYCALPDFDPFETDYPFTSGPFDVPEIENNLEELLWS